MTKIYSYCATFVLHEGRSDIIALDDAFDHGRSIQCWQMMIDMKARMRRPPVDMAFTPPRTLLFQMGDAAGLEVPSLAFGKRGTMPSVRLVPDPYFHRSRGFEKLRRMVDEGTLTPWRRRHRTLFWRGSATGVIGPGGYEELPRVRLAALCRSHWRTDVRIYAVPDQVRMRHDPAEVTAALRAADLFGDFAPMPDFARNRYTVDIDGNANAWSLLEKMLLGLCILKVETPSRQWFYDRLVPWEHFVPVRADLSNLLEMIEWCLAHDSEASAIAEAAQRLAMTMTYDGEMSDAAAAAASVLAPHEPAPTV